MQLKQIARDALLGPLQAVSGIVERRHTLPILANVLLEQKDGQAVRHRHRPGDADHRARRMLAARRPGDHGRRAQAAGHAARAARRRGGQRRGDGSKMTVRAGALRFNLQTLPAGDYPRISVGAGAAADAHAAAEGPARPAAPRRVRDGAAGHPLLPERHAACRSTRTSLQVVATDGHRLSWASLALGGDYRPAGSDPAAQDGARARQAAGRHRRAGHARHRLANQARFRFGNIELVSQDRRGKFPDYQPVIPTGAHQASRARRAPTLAQSLHRAAILSNEKIPRRAPGAGTNDALLDHLHEQRAGGSRGGARRRVQGRPARHRLQHHLPARRAATSSIDRRARRRSATRIPARSCTMPDREDYKYVVMPMRI